MSLSVSLRAGASPWFVLEILDEDALSGKSVSRFTSVVLNADSFKYVICYDVEGAAVDLKRSVGEVISAAEFMSRVALATQYDWAFFFLFLEPPRLQTESSKFLDDAFNTAEATIRLADDTYFSLYSRSKTLRKHISDVFPSATCRDLKPGEISVPF